ncbi:lysophospholipid acyltransferase family protein [Methylobacterium sp. P31]
MNYVEEGREHIPSEPCLIVANHQSAWETLAFLVLVPDVAIIAKRELLAIPVVGWFLRRSPMIVIDRANGTQALRTMIDGCQEAVAAGRSVLIFPEGTRGEMADPVHFKRGVELLYGRLGLTVVPVAVNSGLFWPGGATARPGTIVVSYLAAIAPGLPTAEFLRGTEKAIDRELDRWRTADPAGATVGV